MSRVGNFSSSEIYKLMANGRAKDSIGAPFYTYIQEKVMERRLGRSLSGESNAKPTNWGTFIEKRAFDLMGMEYQLTSRTRYKHAKLPWSGMPDCVTEDAIVDIKSPWTLKSFCDMVEAMNIGPDALKGSNKEYYWQLVSNAILCDKKMVELWVYVPYQDELSDIRDMASNYDGDQNKIAFINWADDKELPYLIKGNYYKNLNSLSFVVPDSDKEALTERVELATKELETLLK